MSEPPSRFSDAIVAIVVFFSFLSLGCFGSRSSRPVAPAVVPQPQEGGKIDPNFWQLKTPPDSYIPNGWPLDAPTDAFAGSWMHLERGNFFIPAAGTSSHTTLEIVQNLLSLRTKEEIGAVRMENAADTIAIAASAANPLTWIVAGCSP